MHEPAYLNLELPLLFTAWCGLCNREWNAFFPDGFKGQYVECPNCKEIIPADLAFRILMEDREDK